MSEQQTTKPTNTKKPTGHPMTKQTQPTQPAPEPQELTPELTPELTQDLCRIQPPVERTVRGYKVRVRQLDGLQQIKLDSDLMSVREKFTEEDEQSLTQEQLAERFIYATAARVKHHIVLNDGTALFANQSLDEMIANNDPNWLNDLYQAIDTATETINLSDAEKNS